MQNTYLAKRARLENYFNEVSSDAWDKLTSNEPVSFIRQLVREGREKMQIAIMEKLPHDLKGMRILDAGCGRGICNGNRFPTESQRRPCAKFACITVSVIRCCCPY